MASEKGKDGFKFSCDGKGCHEAWTPASLGVGSEARDFSESWQSAKADGWRARNVNREWRHFCPSCTPTD